MLSVSATIAHATVINLSDPLYAGVVTPTGAKFSQAGPVQALTIAAGGYDVVFSGGSPLGGTSAPPPGLLSIENIPALTGPGVLYGTSSISPFSSGNNPSTCANNPALCFTNLLTIQFFETGTNTAANITGFGLDLYNGNTLPITYSLFNNLGSSAVASDVPSNGAGGIFTFSQFSGNTFSIFANTDPVLFIPKLDKIGNVVLDRQNNPILIATGAVAWDFFINNITFNEDFLNNPSLVPEPETDSMIMVGLGILLLTKVSKRSKNANHRLIPRNKTGRNTL